MTPKLSTWCFEIERERTLLILAVASQSIERERSIGRALTAMIESSSLFQTHRNLLLAAPASAFPFACADEAGRAHMWNDLKAYHRPLPV